MSRVLGVDVSHWQGVMDWQKTRQAGAQFAIMRAGSHDAAGPYSDYRYSSNARQVTDYFNEIGFYWYFRPNYSPDRQADYFFQLIIAEFGTQYTWSFGVDAWGEYILTEFGVKIRIVADVEETGGMTWFQVRDRVKQFVLRLIYRFRINPVIYCRATFWNICVAPDPLWPTLKLWIARYWSGSEPWIGTSYKPRDWDRWVFWQYSADENRRGYEFGASGSQAIDLNWSYEEPGAISPPPQPGGVIMLEVIGTSGVNLRQNGYVGATIIALMPRGERVTCLKVERPRASGEVWAQVRRQNGTTGYAAVWYGSELLRVV